MSIIDERQAELHQVLAELQRSYQRAAQPIIDELVRLESLKPPKPMIIPIAWPEGEEPPLIRHLIEEAERMSKRICGVEPEAGK